jgi:hypothetical protein
MEAATCKGLQATIYGSAIETEAASGKIDAEPFKGLIGQLRISLRRTAGGPYVRP